jgi:hypothetical protein
MTADPLSAPLDAVYLPELSAIGADTEDDPEDTPDAQ